MKPYLHTFTDWDDHNCISSHLFEQALQEAGVPLGHVRVPAQVPPQRLGDGLHHEDGDGRRQVGQLQEFL
jgi:hypothetical protein